MRKEVKKKQHAGDKNHVMSKDLLKEEFGHEMGDPNASKAYELLADTNRKDKDTKKTTEKEE
ncbi:hypothetical protein PY093_19710 [Cytobacillus sp. S13-E01]|uniref:hypothetical protein n=1 Tax=Cytobacillus sp. S13-E01 TaxID=3031326 RepID=UPI0023D8A66F|nr:hypothetical protein [Cytobacillus sp. S13-E01]MDF0728842.1 hypothetical protein [Cytobacillus sp. S13-E01]